MYDGNFSDCRYTFHDERLYFSQVDLLTGGYPGLWSQVPSQPLVQGPLKKGVPPGPVTGPVQSPIPGPPGGTQSIKRQGGTLPPATPGEQVMLCRGRMPLAVTQEDFVVCK